MVIGTSRQTEATVVALPACRLEQLAGGSQMKREPRCFEVVRRAFEKAEKPNTDR
jgi:hypothetical protein